MLYIPLTFYKLYPYGLSLPFVPPTPKTPFPLSTTSSHQSSLKKSYFWHFKIVSGTSQYQQLEFTIIVWLLITWTAAKPFSQLPNAVYRILAGRGRKIYVDSGAHSINWGQGDQSKDYRDNS